MEAATKDVKRMALGDEDALVESDAQRAARHAEVAKALEEINKEDPRSVGWRRESG